MMEAVLYIGAGLIAVAIFIAIVATAPSKDEQ